ncbi:MAG TPA: methylated-DNA--[protein]-cysteine S-methyltransferase [bacterium]|nr:methylated-DNA--[protein]-cysteine S-methyltransferase [bacterium]
MLMWARIDTMLGSGELVSTEQGLCYFAIYNGMDDVRNWISVYFPDAEGLSLVPCHSYFTMATKQLNEYLDGKRQRFTLPLDLKGTQFQKAVWEELLKVPYGQTISYGNLAIKSGYLGAARAVGSAMRVNPLPIFVPCHRVLRANGSIGNYGGGMDLKRRLLQLEGVAMGRNDT